MGNQWLEKYNEDVRYGFILSNSDLSYEHFKKISFAKKNMQDQVLHLSFHGFYAKLDDRFINECYNATFWGANPSHKAIISAFKKSDKHPLGAYTLGQWSLEIVRRIQISFFVDPDTKKATSIYLRIRCSNIDEIDLRYFNQKNS